MQLLFLLFILYFPIISLSELVHYNGIINTTNENWTYLGKFWISNQGQLDFILEYPQKYEVQSLLFYYDKYDDNYNQWANVTSGNKTCHQKTRIFNPSNNQEIPLVPYATLDCMKIEKQNETWYQCVGNRTFSSRSETWHFVVANCESKIGLYLNYTFWIEENPTDLKKQFYVTKNFNYVYVLLVSIIIMSVESVVLVVSVVFAYILITKNMFHPTFILFFFSLIFELGVMVVFYLHHSSMANNGLYLSLLKACGELLRQLSTSIFLFLLLCLAKGYKIVEEKCSLKSMSKPLAFSILFFIIHAILGSAKEVVVSILQNYSLLSDVYIHEPATNYIVCLMKIVPWFYFTFLLTKSVQKYPAKKKLYFMFDFLATVWFLASPIALLIMKIIKGRWYFELMFNIDSSVMLFGFLMFLFLIAPLPNNRQSIYEHQEIDFKPNKEEALEQ